MSSHFDEALNKLGECVESVGKGLDSIVKDFSEGFNTVSNGTRIRINSGSKVCIGDGVYAILQKDVEAVIVKEPDPEPVSAKKESS